MRLLVSSLLIVAMACGGRRGDGPPLVDAGLPDAGEPPPPNVDIPWFGQGMPPITATERSCPDGYREVTADIGVKVCDPWPESGAMDCTGASAHFPGETACAAIGSTCPAGMWPEGLPAGRTVVYVQAGAAPGGDGTLARPYDNVGFAVSRAPDSAIVAVAKGQYDGRVDLFSNVTVWGACPEETRLTYSASSEMEAVVGAFFGGSVGLRNVTVGSATTMGIYISAATTVELRDVYVDQAWGYGVYFTDVGTNATVEDVIIRNVARFPSGPGGVGLQVVDGAAASLRRVALEDAIEGQLVVAFDSTATLERVSGRRSLGGSTAPRSGLGLAVQESSQATLREVVFEGNEAGGMLVALGSTATATDLAMFDLGPAGANLSSPALEVRVDSTLEVDGLFVREALGGALLGAENGMLTVRDAVIRNTRPSTVSGDMAGLGANTQDTASFTLERVLIEGSHRGGIVTRPGTTLSLTDGVIRDTAASGPRDLGVGATLFGASHRLERVVIDNSVLVGLTLSGETATADLLDVVVGDTQGNVTDGVYGRGIEVNLGARLTGDRVVIERNREVGVFSIDPATSIRLTNAVVRDTLGQACGEACAEGQFGYGVTVLRGGSIDLEGFQIARSRLLGVQVVEQGTFTATRGEIAECEIGVNVQDAPFDEATSLTDVAFRNVNRNIDAMFLPVPDTTLSGESM